MNDSYVNWRLKAKCINQDTRLFYEWYEQKIEVQIKVEAMCKDCPVKQECNEWAKYNKEEGYWGGEYFGPRKVRRGK